MKKYIFLFAAAACMAAASPAEAKKSYGKAFKVQAVQTPEQLTTKLQKQSTIQGVVVKGEIAQVCQAEGCWMKLKNTAGEDMMVQFKNHSFLVPKDIAGKHAVVCGTAMKKTISVEEQRHMAEDAGMNTSRIEAITTPKSEVRIEATGIVVD
jgi:hypothetical protein